MEALGSHGIVCDSVETRSMFCHYHGASQYVLVGFGGGRIAYLLPFTASHSLEQLVSLRPELIYLCRRRFRHRVRLGLGVRVQSRLCPGASSYRNSGDSDDGVWEPVEGLSWERQQGILRRRRAT